MQMQTVDPKNRKELVSKILSDADSVKKSLLDLIASGVIPAEKLRQAFDGMQEIESSAFEMLTIEPPGQVIFHDDQP